MGELVVLILHGILFLGRNGMPRVSLLPTFGRLCCTYFVNPRQLTNKLAGLNITTVEDLRQADGWMLGEQFSVTVERTVAELNAVPCIELEQEAPNKQQIQSSRSFGSYVHELEPLMEAVASYIAIVAEKLRTQRSLAGMVQVYIRINPHKNAPQYQRRLTIPLPEASDDTLRLTRAALWGLKRIYKPGYAYQKAGVALLSLADAATSQMYLFSKGRDNAKLMQVMDRINGIWGRGTLRLAAEGIEKSWKMKRERVSPGYTTCCGQVPVVC